MSDPYVYTPRVNYRNSPYLAPFYTQPNSPFVPPLSLSSSPYSPNIPLPNLEPNSPFIPTGSTLDDDDYFPQPYARPRTTSWTGGAVPANIQNTAWLRPRPQRKRSRSDAGYFDQRPQIVNINNGYWVSPQGSPYGAYAQLPPQMSLHPYLDGQRGDAVFDLMSPHFAPMRLLANNQTILLTNDDLAQPATQPPIYSTKIVSDLIPTWPIDIVYHHMDRYSAVPPPLKLGDVLFAIYSSLQKRISQAVWMTLSPQEVNTVSRVYTARCRSTGYLEMSTLNEGVKRIDFMQGKRWFKGLTLTSDPNVMKLNVI